MSIHFPRFFRTFPSTEGNHRQTIRRCCSGDWYSGTWAGSIPAERAVQSQRSRFISSSSTCRIYVYWFRVVIGLQLSLEPYPQHPPDAIPVRQAKDLPTASFRFPVTRDTLAVRLCASHHRARSGLSPIRFRPCRAHKEGPLQNLHSATGPSISQWGFFTYFSTTCRFMASIWWSLATLSERNWGSLPLSRAWSIRDFRFSAVRVFRSS